MVCRPPRLQRPQLRILPLGHRRALLGAVAELRAAAEAAEAERAARGLPPGAPLVPRNEAERCALTLPPPSLHAPAYTACDLVASLLV